jgi:hypothetical protein
MEAWLVDRSRNYLHGVAAGSVAADICYAGAPFQEHAVPGEKHLFGKRLGVRAIKIDHHLGDALLGGTHPAVVGLQTELSANRRLNACTVENFAFDLRGSDGFGADGLNFESLVIRWD